MRHSRLAALGLMAALAFAIPISSFAAPAPLPDPNVGQYETYVNANTIDVNGDSVLYAPDIGIATAYAEDLGLTNDYNWTISTARVVFDEYNVDSAPPGLVHNYSYVINASDNATSAVVVGGTSSAPTGNLVTFDMIGNDGGSGLAYNDTPAVGSVCSYVGTPTYAKAYNSIDSGAGNYALLHT